MLQAIEEVADFHALEHERRHDRANLGVTVILALLPFAAVAFFAYTSRPATVTSFAMAAVASALLAPLAYSLTNAAPFAEDRNSQRSYFATTGWSPAEKYLGWIWGNLRVQLPLLAILGSEVVLYGVAAYLFPGLGIEVYPRYLPGMTNISAPGSGALPHGVVVRDLIELIPQFLVTWLLLPLYLAFLNLLRSVIEVYVGNELLRKALNITVWVLIFPLGVIYVRIMHTGGTATISEVMSGSATPLALLPDLLLVFLFPLAIALQPLFSNWRKWFSRILIWFLPGYLAVWLAFLVLFQLTGFYGAVAWLVETPVLQLPLALLQPFYLMLNPFTGAEALLTPTRPASIWLYSPAFTGEQYNPELAFSSELLLVGLTLFWTAALLSHGYLGFKRRCYGENPWN